jgi:hypothetical protein
LSKSLGISKGLANTIATIGIGYTSLFSTVDTSLDSIKVKMDEISNRSKPDQIKALYGAMSTELETVIKTQVQPKFTVKVDFSLPPAAIQEAVRLQ